MECDTYQEQISLWLDDQLTEDEIRQIEAHAATCASCRAAMDTLRRLDRLLDATPMIAPVPGFTERVQARLVTRRRRSRTWAGILTLTVATLVLFIGATAMLAASGLTLWGNLAITGLLPQATGLLLDLGKAVATFLNLTWLIASALARGVRHPVFIAYVAATTILIAVWTQIVTRHIHAHRPVSANLNG
jgi:predicted anti-sigma-YlaC factor YlaD